MTSMELIIKQKYEGLSKTEKKIADYFLDNADALFHLPIADLAKRSGVSQAAWVRFAKTLGYEGLKDLKKEMFNEQSSSNDEAPIFSDIKKYPDFESLAKALHSSCVQALDNTFQLLDFDVVDKVIQHIMDAKTVRLFGVGASAVVAEDFSAKLTRIGISNCFHFDTHNQLVYAANALPTDVALLISNSGATQEVLESRRIAAQAGAFTVSLTSVESNPLSKQTDLQLYTSSPEVYYRSGAKSSRIAQLYVVDVLYTAIASSNYDKVVDSLHKSHDICRTHRVESKK